MNETRTTLGVGVVLAGLLLAAPAFGSNVEPTDTDPDPSWVGFDALMRVLEGERVEPKLELFDDPDRMRFLDIDLAYDPGGIRFDRALDRLIAYCDAEPHAWVLLQLLDYFVMALTEGLAPLYESLLDHPAPSVRARAIEGVYESLEFDVPDAAIAERFLAYWQADDHPLVRAAVLRSLAELDVDHPIDCVSLLGTEYDELFTHALLCTDESTDRLADALVEKIVHGPERHRYLALRELRGAVGDLPSGSRGRIRRSLESLLDEPGFAPDRRELLDVLAAAGSDVAFSALRGELSGPDVPEALLAFRQLARLRVPDWDAVIVSFGSAGGDERLIAALDAMSTVEWTPAFDPLFERAILPTAAEAVTLAAIRAIGETGGSFTEGRDAYEDREHLVAALAALERDERPEVARTAAEARSRMADGTVLISTNCGSLVQPLISYRPEIPDGWQTVRCVRAPGCTGFEHASRRVAIADALGPRYDDGTVEWLEVVLADHETCWIRSERMRAEPGPPPREVPVILEVDLTSEQAALPELQALRRHGIVVLFDEGDGVIGARLAVDPADEESMELLRAASALRPTPLCEPVRQFLKRTAGVDPYDPGWEAWFAADRPRR